MHASHPTLKRCHVEIVMFPTRKKLPYEEKTIIAKMQREYQIFIIGKWKAKDRIKVGKSCATVVEFW